jgi:glycogen debranching enzyme
MPSKILQAQKIAVECLRACYADQGIIAGPHHFTDYWARDGFFAALGAIAIDDTEIVDRQIELFFSYQKENGLIPYRIMRGPISLQKYLGKPTFYTVPKPTYRLRDIGQYVLDGTTLSVLFAALRKKEKLIPQIKKGLHFLTTKEKYGLLWDGPMGEWNDVVWKWGNLLYSNIIYWYMYDRLGDWIATIDREWSNTLKTKANSIAEALRTRLWNGAYFADWHDYRRQDYFYPFGNCLAIAWGLATKSEAESILKECEKVKVSFTLETNTFKYPWWRIDLLQRMAGMADYQNHSLLWWQPITGYLAALRKTNAKQVADVTESIVEKIIHDQVINECYERNGSPVKRYLYQSEHPFAWASGMILWAIK